MELIFILIPLLTLALSFGLLIILSVIDLRHFLLPDRYVFPLAALGLLFHASLNFMLLPPEELLMGAIIGGGFLWLVRYGGTKYYKQEAMGLGDVKLLIAGGLWLGPVHVISAIILGALAGLIHGFALAFYQWQVRKQPFTIKRLIIPAGPGFIVGLLVTFIYQFGPIINDHLFGIID